MKRVISSLLLLALWLSSAVAKAQSVSVLTSVKPLALIAHEITLGVGQSQYLIPVGASPHDYALRPSDIQKIKAADLMLWVGPSMSPYLARVIEKYHTPAIELGHIDGIERFYFADDEGHHHGDEHHGHHHGDSHLDAHLWLGLPQAQQIAKLLMVQLSAQDPKHAAQYQANYQRFIQELKTLDREIASLLAPVKQEGYFVFHDAYGYFERHFVLNKLGYFTVDPSRHPGAKTLHQIEQKIQAHQVNCVFVEPQFSPNVVARIAEKTGVRVGTLDPLASTIQQASGSYRHFLLDMTNAYIGCLQGKTN